MEKKIGLVLSGGGTKGISEAGVLQFIEDKNISPEIASVGLTEKAAREKGYNIKVGKFPF